MPSPINLLDQSLGIQNVMDMPAADALPRARDIAANALKEAGLDELYAPSNARHLVENLLCPDVGDGSILSPEAFAGNMRTSMEELASSDDPAVRALVDDLRGLLQNGQLYEAYRGLMIGG